MRGRVLAGLVALAVVDLLVLVLGYRAHTGSLPPLQRSAAAFEVGESRLRRRPVSRPATTRWSGRCCWASTPRATCSGPRAARARSGSTTRPASGPGTSTTAPAAPVEPPAMREVLGLVVYADGKLRVSGLDEGLRAGDLRLHRLRRDLADHRRRGDGLAPVRRHTASTVTGPRGGAVPVALPRQPDREPPGQAGPRQLRAVDYFALGQAGRSTPSDRI